MLQHALKIVLIIVILGSVVQDANAFGRCRGWGGGYCGYGYGGCGYGGYGYGGNWYGYGGNWYGYGGYASYPLVINSQPSSDSVLLTVSVPAGAKVFVNDYLTTSTGERRQFASRNLRPDRVYAYRVRVESVNDGKPVSEEKTVQLTAGQTSSLEFGPAPKPQVVDTATLVPRER